MAGDESASVDMSAEAIGERIATVGQLYRVCLSLASARPLLKPSATPGSNAGLDEDAQTSSSDTKVP
jgi:hypothetical protein